MSTWFSNVFKSKEADGDAAEPPKSPALAASAPKPRRVVEAPVLKADSETSAYSDEIRIKARMDETGFSCTFLVDRPVLEGHSLWAPDKAWAEEWSPLALALFEHGGVMGVQVHDMTVTVILDNSGEVDHGALAKGLGSVIRGHLKSGAPVVSPAFLAQMPREEELRDQLEEVVQFELNPAIAGHGGYIELIRVEGNTAYIRMGGGCQGCAASSVTLRQGVHAAFRKATPYLGAILDETDHASGKNPYFKGAPAGMEG